MSEIVDRVARAIYESELFQPARANDPWDGESSATKAARAAIEAMREPTHEMKLAGCEAVNHLSPPPDLSVAEVSDIMNAMIDAALAETK